jgi:hypothetical protein
MDEDERQDLETEYYRFTHQEGAGEMTEQRQSLATDTYNNAVQKKDTENIYTLINKVMSEVGGVEKNQKNTVQGYSFRGIDDLYAALQPPLVKYGVFFCTDVEKLEQSGRESKTGGVLTCTVLTVKFTFFAPDGSSIMVRTIGEGMDSGDKSCSKAMSTALKYALLQLFCIPTSEPKDSEHDSPEPVYKREPVAATGEREISRDEWKRSKVSVS